MSAILPTFPRYVLTVFEPISLVCGFLASLLSTNSFIADQYPSSLPTFLSPTPNTTMLAMQLGNIYLLLAMIGVAVLYTSAEPKLIRNYVVALAIGDVGHVLITGWVLGLSRSLKVTEWNGMTWGNIGVTIFLFATRMAYLTGLFGSDRVVKSAKQLQ